MDSLKQPLSFFGERRVVPAMVHGNIRGGTMLAKDSGLLQSVADPSKLGAHRQKSEKKVGQIYTRRGGFIDVAHVRNMADNAKSVFDAIAASGGAKGTRIRTRHGELTLTSQLPRDRKLWADLAMSTAYDDGLGYEIMAYGVRFLGKPVAFGMFPSAFSPEDLTSNYLGVHLAREALLRGGDFNQEMTRGLAAAFKEMDAVSPDQTREALEAIKGRWMKRITGPAVLYKRDSLLRRDFERMPRRVGADAKLPMPQWLTAPLPDVAGFYDYTHTLSVRIPKTEWPSWLERIHQDARARLGDGYDSPDPV